MPIVKPLRESTLQGFFLGEVTVSQLAIEVAGCVEQIDSIRRNVHIRKDLVTDFPLTRECLLKLCAAALADELPPTTLTAIAFALIATDHFLWDADDDDVLAAVIGDWSAPEIFRPLTPENLVRSRRWLLSEERYPDEPKARMKDQGPSQLISECHAVFHD